MTIDKMRKDYSLRRLDQEDVDVDPMVQFKKWFVEAQSTKHPEWFEANTMTLSTSGLDNKVTSRVILLKGLTDSGFLFFTNYQSVKGRQIHENPQVSLGFFWPALQRQVNILGSAAKTSRDQSIEYFHSRPRDSQLGALTSQQSQPTTRNELETRMGELKMQFGNGEIPCPEDWGGYEVTPRQIEFWQGRPSRLHDRIVYRRQDSRWVVSRIAP